MRTIPPWRRLPATRDFRRHLEGRAVAVRLVPRETSRDRSSELPEDLQWLEEKRCLALVIGLLIAGWLAVEMIVAMS